MDDLREVSVIKSRKPCVRLGWYAALMVYQTEHHIVRIVFLIGNRRILGNILIIN